MRANVQTNDAALLTLRLVLAIVFIGHGTQKLLGWFGGGGLSAEIDEMGQRGLEPAGLLAVMLGVSEFGGGLLLLLGFLTPLGALATAAVMVGAIAVDTGQYGFFIQNGGFEYNFVLLSISAVLGVTGAGAYSFDRALNSRRGGLGTLLRQTSTPPFQPAPARSEPDLPDNSPDTSRNTRRGM